jgi:hypothetical protein
LFVILYFFELWELAFGGMVLALRVVEIEFAEVLVLILIALEF